MKNPDYKPADNPALAAIKEYLDSRAATDEQFAVAYAKPCKNIDECFRYILNEARKRGSSVCMTDDEVFGLAVHYFDEDDLKVPTLSTSYCTATSAKPVAPVKLTEAEKAAAKEEAIKKYQAECMAEAAAKEAASRKKKRSAQSPAIQSLFDF